MRVKWIVYSGAETFGPWSASQLREELRMGRIDAFDMVSLDGSSEKMPIYEVHELFNVKLERTKENLVPSTEPKPEAKSQKTPPIQNAVQAQPAEMPLKRASGERPRANPPPHTALAPRGPDFAAIKPNDLAAHQSTRQPPLNAKAPRLSAFEALASPTKIDGNPQAAIINRGPRSRIARQEAAPQGNLKGDRRYFLSAPNGRPTGPFTSRDILTLWYAKKIGNHFLVQRAGDPQKIKIGKFAGFYERSAPSGVAFIGQANLAFSAKDRSMFWMFFSLLLASILVAGSLLWDKNSMPEQILSQPASLGFTIKPIQPTPDEQALKIALPEKIVARPVPATLPKIKNPAKKPQKSPGQRYWHPNYPTYAAPTVAKSYPQTHTTPEKSVTNSPAAKLPSPATKHLAASSPASQKTKSERALDAPPGLAPGTLQARPKPKSPAPQPAAKSKPPAWTDGSTITFSGYHFNAEVLNGCTGKCKIPMTGSKGPILAVFFKDAFASSFMGKSEGVSFTGTVRLTPGSATPSIFIQSVQ
jgi:hypothetical protein